MFSLTFFHSGVCLPTISWVRQTPCYRQPLYRQNSLLADRDTVNKWVLCILLECNLVWQDLYQKLLVNERSWTQKGWGALVFTALTPATPWIHQCCEHSELKRVNSRLWPGYKIPLYFLDHFLIKGIAVLKRIDPFPYTDPWRLSEH